MLVDVVVRSEFSGNIESVIPSFYISLTPLK